MSEAHITSQEEFIVGQTATLKWIAQLGTATEEATGQISLIGRPAVAILLEELRAGRNTEIMKNLLVSMSAVSTNPLVWELRNPSLQDKAKEVLLLIAENDPVHVADHCAAALADEEAAARAKEILLTIAAKDTKSVALVTKKCLFVMKDPLSKANALQIIHLLMRHNCKAVIDRCARALGNPRLRLHAAEALESLAEKNPVLVANRCAGMLYEPGLRASLQLMLLKIADRDLRIVLKPMLSALTDPERGIYARGFIQLLAHDRKNHFPELVDECLSFIYDKWEQERFGEAVSRALLILSDSQPKIAAIKCINLYVERPQVENILDRTLMQMAEKYSLSVSSLLLVHLRTDKLRQKCRSLLIQLASRNPGILKVIETWEDRDHFDRKAIIQEIKIAVAANTITSVARDTRLLAQTLDAKPQQKKPEAAPPLTGMRKI